MLCACRGLIKEKVYGKVKLYFPDQAQYGEVTPAEVAALDEELKVRTCAAAGPHPVQLCTCV